MTPYPETTSGERLLVVGNHWETGAEISTLGLNCLYMKTQLLKQHGRILTRVYAKIDPGELCALHKCDNPKCVNPNHLFLDTRAKNTEDMVQKGHRPQLVIQKGAPMGTYTS